jgi:hypothetical protein
MRAQLRLHGGGGDKSRPVDANTASPAGPKSAKDINSVSPSPVVRLTKGQSAPPGTLSADEIIQYVGGRVKRG